MQFNIYHLDAKRSDYGSLTYFLRRGMHGGKMLEGLATKWARRSLSCSGKLAEEN